MPPKTEAAKLFVGKLPHDVAEEALTELFSAFGEVRDVHVMRASRQP